MNKDLTNTITKGSKILNPRNSIGVVTNEDRCIVGVVLSVSGNLVTFRKIWDTEETKVFSARIYVPGIVTPETDPPIEVDEILPFFRVGDFNSDGSSAPEKHTENASNFSWIGFVQPITAYEISDYYALKNSVVVAGFSSSYWVASYYDGLDGTTVYHFNKVNMHRNTDEAKPEYCVPSRNGYATWKAKYYTDYDETTKTYSGLVFTQDCYFVSSLWSYDVILPRCGTGVTNKKKLVPLGYHPFDVVGPIPAYYLMIEEKNTSDYNSTATSDSSTYLYDNSINLTTLLVPGESVTINTTPVQVRTIATVYSDHLSFSEALTTAITTGTTFIVDFLNRGTWIYLKNYPTKFFGNTPSGTTSIFWRLSLPNLTTVGDWQYNYAGPATGGWSGVCEESDELIIASGPTISGPPPVVHGGPIPDTQWSNPTYGNVSMAYCKVISYDFTYKAAYLGGGVKYSRLHSDWHIWDETLSPPAWRLGNVGEVVPYIVVFEIWDGRQRDQGSYTSITLT